MVLKNMIRKNINRRIGARNTNAKSYWDRALSIEEVARLLGMSISSLKHHIEQDLPIKGKPAPQPDFRTTTGKMYFEGKNIKPFIE